MWKTAFAFRDSIEHLFRQTRMRIGALRNNIELCRMQIRRMRDFARLDEHGTALGLLCLHACPHSVNTSWVISVLREATPLRVNDAEIEKPRN